MRFLVFFIFWILALGGPHWYVGRRIIRAAKLDGMKKRLAWLLVFCFFMTPQAAFFMLLGRAESGGADLLFWVGFLMLGIFSLVLTLVFLRDVAAIAYAGFSRVRALSFGSNDPPDRERRRFLIHSTNMGILGLTGALSAYGLFEARGRMLIEKLEISIDRLPESFDGFRIVQFTDLHVGPTIKRNFVEGVVRQVMELKPDLIAYTGDLADGTVSWLRDDVQPLTELRAPHGKFFVTGNHEYYSGAGAWIEEADRMGFTVLLDEHRVIERGPHRIVVAGVTDFTAPNFIPQHTSDPAKSVAGAPAETVKILLAHQPKSIYAAAKSGVDLQLSGHTHGGQFFPWNYLVSLSQPYIKGLHRHENTWVYVSRGTGYWGPPIRVGIPPEITVITLKRRKN